MKELFAYGTLKRGGKWHHLIESGEYQGTDTIDGELYLDRGGYYPILFVGTDPVSGEVWSLSDEAFQRAWDLEADADYQVETVTTAGGKQVIVFFMKDESQKDPALKIDSFDAPSYFQQWLDNTDTESEAYEFFLNRGGKTR